jgi:hypothetical protein
MRKAQKSNAPRMMDLGDMAMKEAGGDMKFMGHCIPALGDDMKMSVEETSGTQHHNPAIPEQPKTMRFLTK